MVKTNLLMKGIKDLRWIVLIAVAAVAELQYVWLSNSYRLARESLRMRANEVFRDASLEEMFHRMESYKMERFGRRDTTFSLKFEVDTTYSEVGGGANQWLMSNIHTAMQD